MPKIYLPFVAVILLLFFSPAASWAQGTISGRVLTSDQQPAANVNIQLKNTSLGAASDITGAFEIRQVPAGAYTLVISFLGLETKELNIEVRSGETSRISDIILNESSRQLQEIVVLGGRSNAYRVPASATVAKMPLKDLENPQVYNAIPKELLREQVVTNVNDALRNATGVSRLWESTGRGGDGAEYYSMRGFAVQPTLINALPGISNGALDPANIERIEVIKGPSGTMFGSSLISYGGLINIVTKRPYDYFGGEVAYTFGSNGLNRITADVNTPLGENKEVLLRINSAYHNENSFQDAGYQKAFYLAPSLSFQASDRLSFHINTEFLNRESVNAPMIFLSRYAQLTFNQIDIFEQQYERSFTSNNLPIQNPTFTLQGQMLYQLSKEWTSQTVFSRSNTQTNGYYSYLWDLSDGNSFIRYISKRRGETLTTDIQQNFIGDFRIGNARNRIVAGIDYYQAIINNSSTGWLGHGTVTISDGNDTGILTQAAVDNALMGSSEGNSSAESEIYSAYVSNVFNITPALMAMASVRVDHFTGKVAYWSEDEVSGQTAVSPKFGLVYQPIMDKVSLFANYMNGFVNVAPVEVADLDGSNPRLVAFDPEQANQMEFGVKANLYQNRIAATLSYYQIDVRNRVISDPNNINNSIQGGAVQSKGFEISIIASPVKGWNIIAGYSNNQSEVTKDNPNDGYLGLRPEEAGPESVFNAWTSYTFHSGALGGFGLGFGVNAASEHLTLNRDVTGTFTLPAYTIFNGSVFYNMKKFSLICKVDNLGNQKYFSGWSTVTPQQLRRLSLGLNYKF